MEFNFNNLSDLESVCCILTGRDGWLDTAGYTGEEAQEYIDWVQQRPESECIKYRIDDLNDYVFNQLDLKEKFEEDDKKRLKEKPEHLDLTIVVANDKDMEYLDANSINELLAQGKKIGIHTPSKLLAPFYNVWYTYDHKEPWLISSDRSITTDVSSLENPATIGIQSMDGIPHLITNPEERLIWNRDEEYVKSLKRASVIKAVDHFGLFAVEMEGLKGELV